MHLATDLYEGVTEHRLRPVTAIRKQVNRWPKPLESLILYSREEAEQGKETGPQRSSWGVGYRSVFVSGSQRRWQVHTQDCSTCHEPLALDEASPEILKTPRHRCADLES